MSNKLASIYSFFSLLSLISRHGYIISIGIGSDESQRPEALKTALVAVYKTNLLDNVINDLKGHDDHYNQSVESLGDSKRFGDWPTTWWQQFCVLSKRGLKQRRHDSFSGLKIGQVLFVSLLCGLLWWKTDLAHLQDQVFSFNSIHFLRVCFHCVDTYR